MPKKVWVQSPDKSQRIQIDPSEIPRFARNGWSFHEDAEATVTQGSTTYSVKGGDKIGKLAINPMFTFESGKDRERREFKESIEDVSPLVTLGSSFLSGISATISDNIIAGIETKDGRHIPIEKLRQVREESALSTPMEILGAVTPMLASAGLSTLAQGGARLGAAGALRTGLRLTPSGMITEAGFATERLLAGKLATEGAKGFMRKSAEGALRLGAGGAVEGSLWMGTEALANSAFSDKELSAEHILGRMGMGALLGFGVGGVLGAAGPAAGKILSKGGEFTDAMLKKVDIDGIANKGAIDALNPDAAVKKAWADEGLDEVAAKLRERDIGVAGSKVGNHEAAAAARKDTQKVIDDTLAELDAATARGTEDVLNRPAAIELLENVKEALLVPMLGSAKNGAAAKSMIDLVDSHIARINSPAGVSSAGTTGGSRAVGRSYQGAVELADSIRGLTDESLGGLGKKTADFIDKEINATAKNVFPEELVDDLAKARKDNRLFAQAEEAAAAELARVPAKSSGLISMGGLMYAMGTGNWGVLPGAMAGELVRQTVKEHGQRVGAAVAHKAASAAGMKGLASEGAKKIRNSVKKLVDPERAKSAGKTTVNKLYRDFTLDGEKEELKRSKGEVATFKRIAEETAKAVSDPAGFSETLQKRLAAVAEVSDEMAGQMEAVYHRAAEFLDSKAPKNPAASRTMNPAVREWKPNGTELSRYKRYVASVSDPYWVVDEFVEGRPFREGAEALRVVWPVIYNDLQVRITKAAAELKSQIPYEKRRALSIMLEVPLEASMEGGFVLKQQAMYGGGDREGRPPQTPKRNTPDAQKQAFRGASKLSDSAANPTTTGTKLAGRV